MNITKLGISVATLLQFQIVQSQDTIRIDGADTPVINGYTLTYSMDQDHRRVLYNEGLLHNGFKIGPWVTWDRFHSIYAIDFYKDSLEHYYVHYGYHSSGVLKESGDFRYLPMLKPDTFDVVTDSNKTYSRQIFIVDSSLYKHGLWTYRHKNGRVQAEGHYVNGVRKGKWKFFTYTGELEKEEEYE